MTRSIPLSSIVIKPNRQRQEFDPERLQELCDSIEKVGLQHAPVLRKEGDAWVLVAGERRLRALQQIFELGGGFTFDGVMYEGDAIPFVSLGELSPTDAEEAELDENLRRADLTWQEHAAAVARLHKLRQTQADAKPSPWFDADTGTSLTKPHTIADTAEELHGRRDGDYQEKTRQEIIVAGHLSNPAIAKAGSAKEAMKILRAQEQRSKDAALAVTVGKTFQASDHLVEHGDCIDWMTSHINRSGELFDVLLCDPPYGMGADTFGDGGGKLTGIEHHYDDSFESWVKLMTAFCPLSYAIAKPQSHAYIFCDIDNFPRLRELMQLAGWYVFRTPFILVKPNSGRVPLPDRGPRRQWESLLYAIKGARPVTHIYPDVITATADEQMGHGAQKPVSVYQNLLQRSVRPGDRCADFFAGTGPIIPAAHALRCYATAVEQDAANYARCVKRVGELKAEEADFFDMTGGQNAA